MPKIEKCIASKKAKMVSDNCAAYSNAVLAKYNSNKKINIEKTAKDLVVEFNQKYKNPILKKEPAFALNSKTHGACNIEYNKQVGALDVVGLDSEEEIIIRIVVKPPSFVRYDRS